jgi:hypothetical protein
MKTSRVTLSKTHKAIFGRLQRCVANLQIWAAFEITKLRPPHFDRAGRYGDFFIWVPDAAIFSFVVRICSLFDSGDDCITLDSYAKIVGMNRPIPQDVRAKIDAANAAVQPLRKVRNAYYAHRSSKGTMSNLFEVNKLTYDKLLSITQKTCAAATALGSLTSLTLPPLDLEPQEGLRRLLADLQ